MCVFGLYTEKKVNSKPVMFCVHRRSYSRSKVQILLDDFNVEAIRRIVYEFYTKKEYPTLDSLLSVVKSRDVFTGGCTI